MPVSAVCIDQIPLRGSGLTPLKRGFAQSVAVIHAERRAVERALKGGAHHLAAVVSVKVRRCGDGGGEQARLPLVAVARDTGFAQTLEKSVAMAQYSSAKRTVSTRRVSAGSCGSGEPKARSAS